jgi:hypothetical protein
MYRRHERRFLTSYLIGVLVLVIVLGFAPLRDPLLDRAESAWLRWDDRWSERVAHGEALVKAGEYETAAAYLSKLDSLFPARAVKHRRDTERMRVLDALGQSYVALGKKRSAMDAYTRLVAFDPRNWRSQYAMAEAALAFSDPDEAVIHLHEVLKIHPNHLPSIRSLIERQVWESDFGAVINTYESYLNAYQLWPVSLRVGSSELEVDVLGDGEFHVVEALLPLRASGTDTLRVYAAGLYAEIAAVEVIGPVIIGRPGSSSVTVTPQSQRLWRIAERLGVEPGPVREDAARIPLPALRDGVERIRMTIRIPKPVDAALWGTITQAYRNRLRQDDYEKAQARTYVVRSLEAADMIPIRE